jgi:DNA-binding LytR/AlgR family response regulator
MDIEMPAADSSPERPRAAPRPADVPPNRIFIRDRDAIVPVSLAAIVRFEADGDHVRVHTRTDEHMMRIKLQDLEETWETSSYVSIARIC